MKQVCPLPPPDRQRRKGHEMGWGRLLKERKRGKRREYPSLRTDLYQTADERIRRLKTGVGLTAKCRNQFETSLKDWVHSLAMISQYFAIPGNPDVHFSAAASSSWGANKRLSTPNRICIIASSGVFFSSHTFQRALTDEEERRIQSGRCDSLLVRAGLTDSRL